MRHVVRWLLVAVLFCGLSGLAVAQSKSNTPAQKPEKLYTVKFENTSWKDVIDWLEKETGLMCITKDKPQGSITLKSKKEYTLGELIDLLNEYLEPDNFTIIRKAQSFSFWPADQKVPLVNIPNVSLEDLKTRGKTEYVQYVITLKDIKADEVIAQVKKTLSPFGDVQSFGKDQWLVRDKAAYVRNVLMVLDAKVTTCNTQYNHKCIYKRASYVAESLRTLLKDSTTDTSATAVPNPGWNDGGWGGNQLVAPSAQTDVRRFRTVNIKVDDATNTLQVDGPTDKLIAAKELVKELDKGKKERPAPGKAEWVAYNVPTGTSEALAKQLMANKYYLNSSVQAVSVGTSQIYVYAYTADHVEISQLLKMPPVLTPVEVKTVTVQPVAMACLQSVVVSCSPVQRFHLFPLRKCR